MPTIQRKSFPGTEGEYIAIHRKMYKLLPRPALCTNCHERRAIDLANISGKYTLEPSDWEYLCRHCHMVKDGRIDNLLRGSEGRPAPFLGKHLSEAARARISEAKRGRKWTPEQRMKILASRPKRYKLKVKDNSNG